eukprot:7000804-Pyramimonas_sp.AAC.1
MEVADTFLPLLEDFEGGAFLASFDYSLAFDLADPAVVERLFGHLGLPASVDRLVAGVWQHHETMGGGTGARAQCPLRGDLLHAPGRLLERHGYERPAGRARGGPQGPVPPGATGHL